MAPVGFITTARIQWVIKNKIESHVQGSVSFTLRSDKSWFISVTKDKDENVATDIRTLITGENERELDNILEMFQKNQLEVKNGKIEKVKQTLKPSRSGGKKQISLDLDDSDSINALGSYFD